MRFQSSEDRLNPITPEGVEDTTLGGYSAVHGRATAFEGGDGEPYTVAIEAEKAEDGDGWVAYLIFLRWSQTGSTRAPTGSPRWPSCSGHSACWRASR